MVHEIWIEFELKENELNWNWIERFWIRFEFELNWIGKSKIQLELELNWIERNELIRALLKTPINIVRFLRYLSRNHVRGSWYRLRGFLWYLR